MSLTDDYDGFTSCTDNENDDINIILKYLLSHPQQPVRCIVTGPPQCEESFFLTRLTLNNINEFEKNHICPPSVYQDLIQKLNKFSRNYKPTNMIANILNEDGIYLVIDEIINKKDLEKSDTGIETFESM